jgi:glycosyltransferase involved in cell wall biosynthesis
MRIAHVTATFLPYYSGTGMVCYHNALGLARLGHDVTVITADHPRGSYSYPPEIAVHRLPVAFRLGNAPLLPKLLGLKDFDIVHLHHPFIFGDLLLWAALKARGIPLVLTHHNDLVGDGLRPLLFDSYAAISTRLLFSSASKLAAVSLDHAAHCRLAPLFRRRWDDVVEIPNGVDAELFRPDVDGQAVRRQQNIPAAATVVLFVGVLDRAHHFKGAGLLLKAFASLKRPDAVLMFVGDGELKPKFLAEAAALGIADQVRFAGNVPNAETPPYYAAADLVVLPTAPPESFGIVLIEAMACGKPVITSNLPGVRSVVSDGEDGLLIATGDIADLAAKLGQLLDDPQRRRVMGARGRAKVEAKYAWPAIIPRLAQLYEQALSEQAAPGRSYRRAT